MHEDYRYEYTGKRRFFFITGAFGVLIGLGLVGLAAYAIFLRPGADDSWLYAIPGRDDDSPAFDAAPPPGAVLAGQKYSLVIERLGVEAPVGVFGLDANAVPEVPYDPDTVAWYDFSSEPGAGGNAVFAGHRTWRGDAVFRHLEDLQAGDRVILRGEGGTQLVYQVFHNELIDPANATASSWMLPTDFEVITLITCGGDYRKTNDPIFGAEYDKRQVVRAALVRDDGSTATGG
jgi:LPXTG-site transpeptidase (sortase) family protein